MEPLLSRACPNPTCDNVGKPDTGNIILYASFNSKVGKKQRCLCKTCGTTFSSNTGTAYHRLRCTRDEFDQVATMRVEGVSISAIARITGRSRSTITRWLERAAAAAKRFNDHHLRKFEIKELQADELWTFVGSKTQATWLFTVIEVWSRLWPSSIVGRRSYRNTEAVFNDVIFRGCLVGMILITTDGFEFYEKVIRKLLGVACVYGQVIKMRRNNRVIRVERHLRLGNKGQLADALLESEDSDTMNTSFVERLNLTLRQALAYLQRRSPTHARCKRRLSEDLALIQCYYNFIRPHSALKLGTEVRTPGMQAGLTARLLSFRDIFATFVFVRPDTEVLHFPTQQFARITGRMVFQLAA